MLGIARIAEKGLLPAAAITAAIAFLGVMAFDMSVMLGLLITPVAIMLSCAVLAFVLLRHQEQPAMTATMVAAVMVFLAAVLTQQFSTQVLVFTGICWAGVLLAASVLRQTISLKLAVLTVAPITIIVGLMGSSLRTEIVHFWQSILLKSISTFSEAELQQLGPEKLDLMRNRLPELLSDSLGSWAFFIVLCALFIGRYWQAQLYNAGGFQKEFHSLRFGKEAVIAFAFATGISLVFASSIFALIASALMFVFFVQGLSVLHSVTKQRGWSRSWLTGMYIILWLPPTMLLLSLLGMVDNFFRLRQPSS